MKQRDRTIQTSSPSRVLTAGVCAAVVILVWIVFGQTLRHDFVNYDDKTYVYGNSLVSAGGSWQGLGRAFVDTQTNNWHPLTIISHMIDCQIFDLKAGGHHFTNVLLHTIAALLLFFFLRDVTGRFWSAAFVSVLFAVHPLRVESVAWVAERKDVLSAVFFFLTLVTYVRYVRQPSFRRYFTMSILFAGGLMSKPMLVTTPVVLLLLDYWPLNRSQPPARSRLRLGERSEVRGQRISKSQWAKLVIEKIPLFGLSLISSIVTFALQVHSPVSVGQLPLAWRLQNALVTYVTYIWQIFWPIDLAVFYPYPDNRLPFWQVAFASGVLIAITWIVFRLRKARPYLLVGWLWYLIMLLPVIGILEVGLQGHADRYTYLPHVGLYLMLTWTIAEVLRTPNAERRTPNIQRRRLNSALGVGCWTLGVCFAVIIIAALAWRAWDQTRYWRDSETLWTHTLAVTEGNDVALTNLGTFLMDRGQLDDALSYFQRASVRRASTAITV